METLNDTKYSNTSANEITKTKYTRPTTVCEEGLQGDMEPVWEITFHLPYFDTGDSFDDDNMQFSRTKVLATSKQEAIQYGEQFIRLMQRSQTSEMWEDAEIYSIAPFNEE